MGVEDLRGLATIFCMIAFAAIVYWAYGPSRKQYFEQAAELPFAEEDAGNKKQETGESS